MSHYETLGVDENATADQIKKAYRERAKYAHPDKGGKQADFEPLVQAYEVLKDPVRRQLYDTTGQDKRPPIEVEVQNVLMQGFNQALSSTEDIEIVAFVRNGISGQLEQIPKQIKDLKARKKKLEAKRGKIKSKGPVNLVHLIIDGELKGITAQLTQFEYQIEVSKACLKALDSYSEDWTPPPPRTRNSFEYFITTQY